ncbi:MAG: LacI family DNA-binding transcriptional regulator [Devosia sp.]
MTGRSRPPTIIDVAREAGVSVGTVSRYLNGIEVRDNKRLTIEGAIKRLNYNRNAAAKAMRTERTNMVALLVPGYDEYFAGILSSLTRALAREGQVLLTHKHEGDQRALALALEFFQTHRVNAVITPGVPQVRAEVERLVQQGIPVIFFNNDVPGLDVDRVFSKNEEGAHRAVNYLLDLGHRHIGFVGGDESETSAADRQLGYRRALTERGISVRPDYVVGGTWRRQDAYAGARRLMELDKPPTAIFTANYVLALAVLDHLHEIGKTVGEDVSLVSFDDVELFKQIRPMVTAVAQPKTEIGEHIAEIVLSHLDAKQTHTSRTVLLDCSMVLRDTARPPKR